MNIFSLLFLFFIFSFSPARSQDAASQNSFHIELRTGAQQHFIPSSDTEHLVDAYDSLYFDNKKHYTCVFKTAHPIELIIGYEYKKRFRGQINFNYYWQDIALQQSFGLEQPYPLAISDMLMIKVAALFDVLNQNRGKRIYCWAGLSTGAIIPFNFSLTNATVDHFGINKFKQNSQWLLGLDYLITIQITKHLYVLPAMSIMFPVAGSIGELEMYQNSEYESTRPVRVYTLNWLLGIGYRFSAK